MERKELTQAAQTRLMRKPPTRPRLDPTIAAAASASE
jgi:hypothetical protein